MYIHSNITSPYLEKIEDIVDFLEKHKTTLSKEEAIKVFNNKRIAKTVMRLIKLGDFKIKK